MTSRMTSTEWGRRTLTVLVRIVDCGPNVSAGSTLLDIELSAGIDFGNCFSMASTYRIDDFINYCIRSRYFRKTYLRPRFRIL